MENNVELWHLTVKLLCTFIIFLISSYIYLNVHFFKKLRIKTPNYIPGSIINFDYWLLLRNESFMMQHCFVTNRTSGVILPHANGGSQTVQESVTF
jgi:hypothetical protein